MTKRRSSTTVRRGRGAHGRENIREFRVQPGMVVRRVISKQKHGKEIEMEYTKSIQRRAAAFRLFIIRAALVLLAILGLAWRWQCHGQTRFEFTSEMVEDHGENTVYEAAVYVHAYADTLQIIFPAKRGAKPVNLLFWGIDWIWTDSGALYYNSTTGDWRGRYTPGTGELWVKTGELNMSIYRKKTIRL